MTTLNMLSIHSPDYALTVLASILISKPIITFGVRSQCYNMIVLVQVLRLTEFSASITCACTYGKQYVMVPDMYAHRDGPLLHFLVTERKKHALFCDFSCICILKVWI